MLKKKKRSALGVLYARFATKQSISCCRIEMYVFVITRCVPMEDLESGSSSTSNFGGESRILVFGKLGGGDSPAA